MQLNLTNKSGISTQKPMLKPWAIHDVILKSVEYSEFAKKDDPSQQFKTMKIRFENRLVILKKLSSVLRMVMMYVKRA